MPRTTTVSTPTNHRLVGELSDHPDGVRVVLRRRGGRTDVPDRGFSWSVEGDEVVDAPFHVVADRVYDLIRDAAR